ncbi:MAG: DnaJ domain-containing protein [Clostridiales bacterium]|nr:DnaJ domain-containing protein [Clostridiales bacterium]
MSNLYRVLGISSTATEEEIKKAYRTLSKKYHPDANPGDKAAEKHFQEVAEAYSVLQNPQKRKAYDQKLQKSRIKEEFVKSSSVFRQKSDKKQKANPLDVTDMFERYMGIKR